MNTLVIPKSSKPAQPTEVNAPIDLEPKCRYIRSIEVENVRTFGSNVKLDCCFPDGKLAQWTIVLGENGTGKTTLLQYIAGMVPVQDVQMVLPTKTGDPKGIIPLKPIIAESDYLMWHFENLTIPRNLPKSLKAHVYWSKPATNISTALPESEKTGHGKQGLEIQFDASKNEGLKASVNYVFDRRGALKNQIVIVGYGAGRHVAGPTSPYLSRISANDSPIGNIFNDDVPIISPEQWLLSLDHQSQQKTDFGRQMRKALDRAKDRLCSILPDVHGIDIRPYGIPQQRMTVFFETSFGPVRFEALSLGYRAMAAWIIDFIRRMHIHYPQLPEPEKGPAIVLIDEFDLHMHVKWQVDMIEWLSVSFPNTQFIITAHSPLVVQSADGRANLAVLKRTILPDGKEQVKIENDPNYVSGWRVEQILKSDLYGLASTQTKEWNQIFEERRKLALKDHPSEEDVRRLADLNRSIEATSPPEMTSAQEWLNEKIDQLSKRKRFGGKRK